MVASRARPTPSATMSRLCRQFIDKNQIARAIVIEEFARISNPANFPAAAPIAIMQGTPATERLSAIPRDTSSVLRSFGMSPTLDALAQVGHKGVTSRVQA